MRSQEMSDQAESLRETIRNLKLQNKMMSGSKDVINIHMNHNFY